MTEKELIKKISLLKEIKPKEEWVFFTKRKILQIPSFTPPQKSILENFWQSVQEFFSVGISRKLAYALPVLFLIFLGVFGLTWYNVSIFDTSKSLTYSGNDIMITVKNFKDKSQNLAKIIKNNPTDDRKILAIKEIKEAARNLTDVIQKNPALTKEIALELKDNKDLLSLDSGSDVKEASDSPYRTIDGQMFKDLNKTTLTQDQQNALNEAKNLYEKENYYEALEKILLIK